MKRTAWIGGAAAVLAIGAVATVGLSRSGPAPAPAAAAREILLAPSVPATADVATLTAATKRAPGDAGAWIALGNKQLAGKNFAAAIDAYRRGLAIDPDRSETWSALGEAYIQSQRSETAAMPTDAKNAFAKAIALDPRDLRARFYATMERDFAGQHDRAVGEWLAMLREAPMGSDADEAIRAALAASVNRNLTQIKVAMEQATRSQPRVEHATGKI